jgi:hypothetical protein
MITLNENVQYTLALSIMNNSTYGAAGYDYESVEVTPMFYLNNKQIGYAVNAGTAHARIDAFAYGTSRTVTFQVQKFDMAIPSSLDFRSPWKNVPRGNTTPIELRAQVKYTNPVTRQNEYAIIPNIEQIELVQFTPEEFVPGFDVNVNV